MSELIWVELDAAFQIHSDAMAEFGGSLGVRDRGAIESALSRPTNPVAYGQPDVVQLAAAYTAGVCRNHGFVDGNKRTAFLVGYTFLNLNGYTLNSATEQAEVIAAMLALADGSFDETAYAAWLLEHVAAL